ncbi:hypothetical protein F4677DRAFT_383992 [Hypoxylon crocopeplum]|nr:hypothetical protein F4677DRAFT_383992 [Hypoxylon crocopeplum]
MVASVIDPMTIRPEFAAASRPIEIEPETSLGYLGTASISLDVLHFPYSKGLDLEKVKQLERLFRAERCRPSEPTNRIPAIVDKSELERCVSDSGISSDQLRHDTRGNHARLEFPDGFRLECLRGRHRAKAAEEILGTKARRWIVDLYSADIISPDLTLTLMNEYSNQSTPSHGEFFYRIREFQGAFGERNEYFESRWRARLGHGANSTYLQRLNQLINHPEFGPAFDISTLEAIQFKAPGACQTDADEMRLDVQSGRLFGAFTEQERDTIWTKLCAATTACVIPSLFGFFEDRKYLEGPAYCLKQLMNVKKGETIHSTLVKAFSYSKKPARYALTDVQWFDFAYRTLWLYAIREYQDMLPEKRRKLAKPKSGQANEKVLFEFASLAYELGVETREIYNIRNQDPDRAMAGRFLKTARKTGEYRFQNFDARVGEMVNIFRAATPLSGRETAVDRTVDSEEAIHAGSGEEGNRKRNKIKDDSRQPNRCGLPKDADQFRDKPSMYLAKLHTPDEEHGPSLSSFFIQRATYFAYFGKEIDIPLKDLACLERDILHAKKRSSCNPKIGDNTRQNEESMKLAELEKEQARELARIRQQL